MPATPRRARNFGGSAHHQKLLMANRNCLKRAQINTVGELLLRSEEDLLNITNFGQKSLDEIKLKLDERGLSLRI